MFLAVDEHAGGGLRLKVAVAVKVAERAALEPAPVARALCLHGAHVRAVELAINGFGRAWQVAHYLNETGTNIAQLSLVSPYYGHDRSLS